MDNGTPIAIIGYAYRAPGVGRKGLWEFLAEAKSAWSKVPADRFDQDAFYHPDSEKPGGFSSQGAHFLPDDIYGFDAPFFNLRAEEARSVDPQHRIMLECAFEAAESAGLSLAELAGANIGVFSAIGSPEYAQQLMDDLPSTTRWTATGVAGCMFANRLSYFFDLTGPSVALDTACASSTYAIHMACQSLRAGECNAAFVGAASLIYGPDQWNALNKMGALSTEGKCFSYDAKAAGFGRGEGAGCLVIKRLQDAIDAGDPIQAVIRNSACNHSGRSEGITMPSAAAQERLLLRVHQEIGLSPTETPVVEGHGTGTQVGDPIEAGAFATVLGSDRTASNTLYIGSLKSNFGHLEGSSGMLAVIKAVMMLQRGYILPNANFEKFNVNIKMADKLRVAQTTVPWPQNALKRVCVTNFGFGGSNAAVILDKAPSDPQTDDIESTNCIKSTNGTRPTNSVEHTNGTRFSNGNGISNGAGRSNRNEILKGNGVAKRNEVPNGHGVSNRTGLSNGSGLTNGRTNHLGHDSMKRLFVVSAKSESTLIAYLSSFKEYLDTAPDSNSFAKDLSFTLGQRRSHHPYRIAVAAESIAILNTKLTGIKVKKAKDQVIAFAFTGQGAQHAQMAAGIRHYKPFAAAIDQAEAHLQELGAPWSLRGELDKPQSESRINDAEISQPACTAVQLALLALLKSWGVTPAIVTGHSSGEIAAAFAAGLVSFEAAVAIAYFRGQAVTQLAGDNSQKGAMLALGVGFEEALTLIEQNTKGYATIAAINSPQSITISGDVSAIENIHLTGDAQGLFVRRLKVEVAYHSRHMEQVTASYLASIEPYCNVESQDLGYKPPHASFVSSVTGRRADKLDASYWVKNLLQTVKFADAIENLFSTQKNKINEEQSNGKSPNLIVEIGPHSALQNPIKQTLEQLRQRGDQRQEQLVYLPSLMRGTEGDEALLELAGSLFAMGVPIQLETVNLTDKCNAHVISNLPAYSWDRSVQYMHRTRFVEGKLHPGQPLDALLGWKKAHGVSGEHIFRQVFTLDQLPWIRDHNVAGTVIFPMTGYLSMAIEALRRVSPSVPSSILIREFHAKRSLEIEDDERVDITTKLVPVATGTESFSSTSWTFEILSWSKEHGWTAHCHGQIEAEAGEMTMESPTFKASFPLIGSGKLKECNAREAYDAQPIGGTLYGPAFQSTLKFWEAPGWTVMESQLRDLNLLIPSSYGSLVSVDPPTLDGFLQGFGPLQEVSKRGAGVMPNYVSRLRISNKIPAENKQKFTVVTRLLGHDPKSGGLRISIAAFAHCAGSLMPIAEWESVTFKSIGSLDDSDQTSTLPASYYLDLIPTLDFADNDDMSKIITPNPIEGDEIPRRRKSHRAAIEFMNRALNETAGDDYSKLPPHLFKFVNWAKEVVAQDKALLVADPSSLWAEVSTIDAQGEMLCAVGEQLVQILRSEVQPLEIMLKDGLLTRNYEQDIANARAAQLLARCARQIANVKSDLRILEIGGGTGSATFPVMEELSNAAEESPSFASYTFTDISPGFFENVRTKLARWSKRIIYKKLDISQDPAIQGFALEDYDLIIASNVLHATADMAATLDNVRRLLKPNGKLVLLEGICHSPAALPFSLLPGWWYAEDDFRSHDEGPLLSTAAWQRLLSARGFSGVDGELGDYPGTPEHMMSVMCSTKIGMPEDRRSVGKITICGPLLDNEEEAFAQLLADQISDRLGCETLVKPFMEIDAEDDQYCIFIDSSGHSVLSSISSESFEALQTVLLDTTGLLWVVPENQQPEAQSMKGMLHTLRRETESKNLLWFENVPRTSQGALAIVKLSDRLRDAHSAGNMDQDFVWHKDMIHLPRFRQAVAAKEIFGSEEEAPVRKLQNIWEGEEGLELALDAAGSPDSIYFRRTSTRTEPLGEDDILIKVDAIALNFRDLLLVLGSIPWSPPGLEGVGVVVKTGSRVTDLQVGDRICYGAYGGCCATYLRLPAWMAYKIPDDMSSADAASISVAYTTAYMSLTYIARLKMGESVLIHAASGAVGQACIVLAQHAGAQVFATAGNPAKREFLYDTFGIPKERIFSSRTPEFGDGIMCATNGRGVDVVVNSLSGNLLQETWSVIAEFGRFVEIGKKDFLQNNYLPMRQFDRNVTFSGVDLKALFEKRPEMRKRCLVAIADLLVRKVIVPIRPITKLPISQLATGLRKLQSGQSMGKIVITFGPEDCVLAECSARLRYPTEKLLRPDVTYIITGGTSGIGLSLGPWMVENGARNIVLLGRSGDSRPEVKKLIEHHAGTNVCVRAIACDVGSPTEFANALRLIQDLPPVRGVVHGALFLRDALFMNANHEDWQNIRRPRVQGAWNLHEALPELDFFIILSSLLGATGNIGQAIYASTASFFDAFAEYRIALGLPAVAIALPVVLDVGYVADRGITEQLKVTLGCYITAAQLRTIVKGAIIGPTSGLNFNGKTVTFGLSTGCDTNALPWKCLNPRLITQLAHAEQRDSETNRPLQGGDTLLNGIDADSGDPFENLLNALMGKVSSITMIERDDVEADAPLANYSLDSLVSVELRNWIRKETGVDLTLPKIVRAPNLRAVAAQIASLRK